MSVGRSQSLRGKGYDRTSFIFDSPPPKDSETSSLESMESLKSFLEVSENPSNYFDLLLFVSLFDNEFFF